MKKRLSLLAVVMLICTVVATASASEVTDLIINARTTQTFLVEPVLEEDITTILQAGLSATSAINQQPWFFVAVTNQEVMDEISGSMSFGGSMPSGMPEAPPTDSAPEGEVGGYAGNTPDGAMPPAAGTSAKATLGDSPVAIIIYMDEGTSSPNASFDCGLACQNMVTAANALGYGTKIVSSPTMALNGDNHDALCEKLGVDPSFNAVSVLLIGHADSEADSLSSATTRNQIDEKVSFVK